MSIFNLKLVMSADEFDARIQKQAATEHQKDLEKDVSFIIGALNGNLRLATEWPIYIIWERFKTSREEIDPILAKIIAPYGFKLEPAKSVQTFKFVRAQ